MVRISQVSGHWSWNSDTHLRALLLLSYGWMFDVCSVL